MHSDSLPGANRATTEWSSTVDPVSELHSVVIVGSSLAGLRAAETLRTDAFAGRITIVGAEDREPYDRPPLSKKLLSGEWEPARTDEPLPRRLAVKAYNHVLGSSSMSFFCAPALARRLEGPFPECLNGTPMLIPGAQSTVRSQFDAWLTLHGLRPRIVGEFDDGALMKAFGREGRGVFISPRVVEEQTCTQYDVQVIGHSNELVEQFYAISVERRISHPGVAAITQAARAALL